MSELGPERARILVCQPFFGQGNRLNALLSCLSMAMATDRVLLVDWHGQASDVEDGGDNVAAADGELSDLVHAPALAWDAVNATALARMMANAAAAGELHTGALPTIHVAMPLSLFPFYCNPHHHHHPFPFP